MTGRERKLLPLLSLLLIAGLVAMIMALRSTEPQRAWEIYMVNLLFWSGVSQAGVVFSAIMVMTDARWWQPLRRISEGMASFLPLSFLLYLLLFLYGGNLFPWTLLPEGSSKPWLDWDSMVVRDILGIAFLYVTSFLFLFVSIRREREGAGEDTTCRLLRLLAPILVVIYTLVYTLLSIDLVMTLSSPWYSALFGGYFFIGNLYAGLAAIAVLAILLDAFFHEKARMGEGHRHDLGKLIFAFCMITGYLFWSQFLVIWYGNIPEETFFILRRTGTSQWSTLSHAVLLIAFILPFVVLLSRRVKVKPLGLGLVSLVILLGMWLERYILVVPSTYPGDSIPFGWMELMITLGFMSLCLISYMAYMRAVPALYSKTSRKKGLSSSSD